MYVKGVFTTPQQKLHAQKKKQIEILFKKNKQVGTS